MAVRLAWKVVRAGLVVLACITLIMTHVLFQMHLSPHSADHDHDMAELAVVRNSHRKTMETSHRLRAKIAATSESARSAHHETSMSAAAGARFELYSEKGCRGEHVSFELDHKEKNCQSCVDFCGKSFASGKDALQVASAKLAGNTSVLAALYLNCAGTYHYTIPSFSTYILPGDGCVDVNGPTHVKFLESPAANTPRAELPLVPKPDGPATITLKYYDRFPLSAVAQHDARADARYVTFNNDCGGWNNIRMGFEHAIAIAWATNRTLVLPPPTPFYLIDFGPTAFKSLPGEYQGHSSLGEFFNLDALQQLPGGWITTHEFFKREKDRFGIPEKFHEKYGSPDLVWLTKGDMAWSMWLHDRFHGIKGGPLVAVYMDPSKEEYMSSGNRDDLLVANRRDLPLAKHPSEVLHFPACQLKPEAEWRYLGQVASVVLYASVERERAFHRFWRSAVVYSQDIFDTAADVIDQLGLFQYSSLHIRRNELQYKDSFQTSQATLRNIDALLLPNETIYLATDETKDPNFFRALRAAHPVFTWFDFYDDETGTLRHNKQPVRKKVIGCIEQLICAGGRQFFGTVHSTFSAYIFRLRGYIGAPDTTQRHHNTRYSGYSAIDNLSLEPVDGLMYMKEDPRMWEVV